MEDQNKGECCIVMEPTALDNVVSHGNYLSEASLFQLVLQAAIMLHLELSKNLNL